MNQPAMPDLPLGWSWDVRLHQNGADVTLMHQVYGTRAPKARELCVPSTTEAIALAAGRIIHRWERANSLSKTLGILVTFS